MITVDLGWHSVFGGWLLAVDRQAELARDLEPVVAEAREQRHAGALADWEARRGVAQRDHERRMAEWHERDSLRRRELQHRVVAWEQEHAARRALLVARVARARSLPSLGLAAAGILFVVLVTSQLAYGLVAALVGGAVICGPAVASLLAIHVSRLHAPVADHAEDALPTVEDIGSRPQPEPEQPVSFAVVASWWAGVAHRGLGRNDPNRNYGTEGEELVLAALARRLADDHVAIPGPLVKSRLDADLVLVGSTGLWVFEVKHVTGLIECHDGSWQQTKTYYEPGGRQVAEVKPFRLAPDHQWLLERDAITQTLRSRVRRWDDLGIKIRGGVLFSLPGATFDIDGTHKSDWGTLDYWAPKVCEAPNLAQMTPRAVLEIIDAILARNHQIQRQKDHRREPGSAIDLAPQLSAGVVAAVEDYRCGR